MKTPIIDTVDDVTVVREDMLPGGTKTRYLHLLFEGADEVAYASSHCGGGQVALAHVAMRLGKQATIFAAARAEQHPRQVEAQALGARYVWIRPGYQNVIEARARQYCQQSGARMAPFGLKVEGCEDVIADAASSLKIKPRHVWVSAGSGTLARGLQRAWGDADLHAVQVGADVNLPGATVHVFAKPYKWAAPAGDAPFNADRHYEIKTWSTLKKWRSDNRVKGPVLFWNACGAAQ